VTAAAVAVLLVLAASVAVTPARAGERSFRATDLSGRSALFHTVGVRPARVVRAQIKVGRFDRRVSLRGVRRGFRRGRLRVHVPKAIARRLRARVRLGPRTPRLRIRYATPRRPSAPRLDVVGVVSGFETGDFSEFVGASSWAGEVSVSSERAYEGSHSAKGVYSGGESGAMRTWHSVDWHPGSDVWYGLALYIPEVSDYCYWNPLRWDNYKTFGGSGDVGGLTIEGGRLSLTRSLYGGTERKLVDGGRIPQGRWVWLEVHQRFAAADGAALSELYVDGSLRGRSAAANSEGRVINHLRYGAVNVAGSCSRPGAIYFDRASISDGPRGPLG
jgi:hypothetical protein